MHAKSYGNGNGAAHSFANGNAPDLIRKSQRDTGFDIRPESSWTLTLGI